MAINARPGVTNMINPEGQKGLLGGEIPIYEDAKIMNSATQCNQNLIEMETNDPPVPGFRGTPLEL